MEIIMQETADLYVMLCYHQKIAIESIFSAFNIKSHPIFLKLISIS